MSEPIAPMTQKWTRSFAWLPVRVGDRIVWLREVEERIKPGWAELWWEMGCPFIFTSPYERRLPK